jgi:hypothetical protein
MLSRPQFLSFARDPHCEGEQRSTRPGGNDRLDQVPGVLYQNRSRSGETFIIGGGSGEVGVTTGGVFAAGCSLLRSSARRRS